MSRLTECWQRGREDRRRTKVISLNPYRGVRNMLLFVLLFSFAHTVQAQEDRIEVIARAKKSEIWLRWAPNTPMAWHFFNKYGVTVERVTIMRDGKVLDHPEHVQLVGEPIKPEPLACWRTITDTNEYAAVAAQAIYGETFEVNQGSDGGSYLKQMVLKSKELETRFSFALSAADFSREVARMSGLFYKDKQVDSTEKYVYHIIPLVPDEKHAIDTGFVFVGLGDFQPLPKPQGLRADFNDRAAFISWQHFALSQTFIAYNLERSDDGGATFFRVNKKPIVNAMKGNPRAMKNMFFIDSLSANNKYYSYRLQGITSFGEQSPYSDTVKGMPYKRLPVNPNIYEIKTFGELVSIDWEFPDSLNSSIQGFDVLFAPEHNGPYNAVNDSLLPADLRTIGDKMRTPVGYYKICAYDIQEHEYPSYPYMVQLIDSIPPKAPHNLEAKVDKGGQVTLVWQKNSDVDLLGYKIFRSNFRNSEFGQVHAAKAIMDTSYIDSIPIYTLTEKIYYKIQAVDRHYNPSEFSNIVELERPDVIPPVPPVLQSISTNEQGMLLEWVLSPSSDVVQYQLYRRSKGQEQWSLQAGFAAVDSVTAYLDTTTVPNQLYQYTLLCRDDAGLESVPAKPRTMRQYEQKILPAVQNLQARVDAQRKAVVLTWDYAETAVKRYVIYRKVNDELWSTWRKAPQNIFIDKEVKPGNRYAYRIKPVLYGAKGAVISGAVNVMY